MTESQPKFLNIYNTSYEEIQLGKFPSGQALPTEKLLCERFDVSRMTLRQAIKLLVEDGVIESVRGKGHIVIAQSRTHHTSSVTLLQQPLHQMSRYSMTLDSLNYRVDLQSNYTNHLFPHHPSAVIALERYYFKKDNPSSKADAYCFTFLPLNVVDAYQINTQSLNEMESAALHMNASYAGVEALGMFTVSDHMIRNEVTTPEERERAFTDMIEIALSLA
ncbi:GntR family transcriptional regulator [Staphylococcus saccharolyticus]|uniref:GntR family transcriptional regulator n=1 Tax=Staphylococcus saccharolyticus TaxID=33028 RepID=UPI0032DEF61E